MVKTVLVKSYWKGWSKEYDISDEDYTIASYYVRFLAEISKTHR